MLSSRAYHVLVFDRHVRGPERIPPLNTTTRVSKVRFILDEAISLSSKLSKPPLFRTEIIRMWFATLGGGKTTAEVISQNKRVWY